MTPESAEVRSDPWAPAPYDAIDESDDTCQWHVDNMRTICGNPLPCSRHQHDKQGHPFGFTVHETEESFMAEVRSPAPSVDHGHESGIYDPDNCIACDRAPSLRDALYRHFGEGLSDREYDAIVRIALASSDPGSPPFTGEQALDLADRRMRVLIGYAVEAWGPESDVDPDADNPSMRADLETFLDVEADPASSSSDGHIVGDRFVSDESFDAAIPGSPSDGGLDPMPVGVSEGLASICADCGERPRFDYLVDDDFWRKWVPDMPARISVVCLPCLDKRCNGVGLAEALGRVDWTGTRHTVSLQPSGRYFHDRTPLSGSPSESED